MGGVGVDAAGVALAMHRVRRRRRRARRPREAGGSGVTELGILVEVLEMVGVLETVKDFLLKLVSGAGRRRGVDTRRRRRGEAHALAGTDCCWCC